MVITATTSEAELPEAFDAGNIDFEEDLDFATAGLSAALGEDEAPRIKGMTVGADGIRRWCLSVPLTAVSRENTFQPSVNQWLTYRA